MYLLGGGRLGQLWMQEAAVPCERAASRVDRRNGLFRERLANLLQLCQPVVGAQRSRLDGSRRSDLVMHSELGQEIVMRPGHRIENLQLLMTFRIFAGLGRREFHS